MFASMEAERLAGYLLAGWLAGRKSLLCGCGSTGLDIWIQFAGSTLRQARLCQGGISTLWFLLPWAALNVIPHFCSHRWMDESLTITEKWHFLLREKSSSVSLPLSSHLIRTMNFTVQLSLISAYIIKSWPRGSVFLWNHKWCKRGTDFCCREHYKTKGTVTVATARITTNTSNMFCIYKVHMVTL